MARISALGAEFFRWEFATAVAGAILAINPFDEPNVAEAKEKTKAILASAVVPGGTWVPAGGIETVPAHHQHHAVNEGAFLKRQQRVCQDRPRTEGEKGFVHVRTHALALAAGDNNAENHAAPLDIGTH